MLSAPRQENRQARRVSQQRVVFFPCLVPVTVSIA
jgi:hypothetical protein